MMAIYWGKHGPTQPHGTERPPRLLDSLLPEGAEPLPAAHIWTPRRGYLHHGIYIGGGRVVHYAGLAHGLFPAPVQEVSLAEFARGRHIWTRWRNLSTYGRDEVIRRALSRVGENQYRLLRNNCEHFCEWCLRGESRSYQVERFFSSRHALLRLLAFLALAAPRDHAASRIRAR